MRKVQDEEEEKGGSKNTRNDIPENKFDHGSGGMLKRNEARSAFRGGLMKNG